MIRSRSKPDFARCVVGVLRCMGDDPRAMTAAAQGLANHPQDPQLLAEFNALQSVGVKPALKVA